MSAPAGSSPRLRRRDLRTADAHAGAAEAPATTSEAPRTRREIRLAEAARTAAAQQAGRPVRRRDLRVTSVSEDVPVAGPSAPEAGATEQTTRETTAPETTAPEATAPERATEEPTAPEPATSVPAPSGAPRTRRALRAAARAAEALAARPAADPADAADPVDAADPEAGPAEDPTGSVPPVPQAPADVAAAASRTPTRRELRVRRAPVATGRPAVRGAGGRRRPALSRTSRPAVRTTLVAAAAAVGTLGVVVPVAQQHLTSAEAQVSVQPQVSALSAPSYSVLTSNESESTTLAPELMADGGAGARASYAAASRSEARADLQCSPEVAASGARAALDDAGGAVMPVAAEHYRMSSGYGWRVHPISGTESFHTGDDFAAPFGTPIHAVADGVVTHVGPGIEGRSGTLVIIEHEHEGRTFETWSTHMAPTGVHVAEGDTVTAGQHFADIGSWGNSTGPHLHLEVHVDGETVDPTDFLDSLGAVDPARAC